MNEDNEDFELDKKLYEVSKWQSTEWWHKGSEVNGGNYVSHYDGDNHTRKLVICPHYDLEYLLAKLPSDYALMWHDFEDITLEDGEIIKQGRTYLMSKLHEDMTELDEDFYSSNNQTDTPRQAAIKLCLELFAKDKGLLQ